MCIHVDYCRQEFKLPLSAIYLACVNGLLWLQLQLQQPTIQSNRLIALYGSGWMDGWLVGWTKQASTCTNIAHVNTHTHKHMQTREFRVCESISVCCRQRHFISHCEIQLMRTYNNHTTIATTEFRSKDEAPLPWGFPVAS